MPAQGGNGDGDAYLMLVETVVNVVERLVPTTWTAPMITTAMSAAIRPYSMAVAPDSSRRKEWISLVMVCPDFKIATRVMRAGGIMSAASFQEFTFDA